MATLQQLNGQQSNALTLFAVDTHANPLASSENDMAQMITAICGHSCSTPFAIYDQNTQSWKTYEATCLLDLEPFLQTWPQSGSMQNGECYEQPTLARHTDENECLSWPTPTASNWLTTTTVHNTRTRLSNGQKYSARLVQALALREPTAIGYVNPEWLEWLMGFPTGWTDLGD
jgi:hypothetical protein